MKQVYRSEWIAMGVRLVPLFNVRTHCYIVCHVQYGAAQHVCYRILGCTGSIAHKTGTLLFLPPYPVPCDLRSVYLYALRMIRL